MPETGIETPTIGGTGEQAQTNDQSLGDADPTIATLDDVYLDETLVLVGGDPAHQRDPDDPVDLHEAVLGPDERIRRHGPTGPAWQAGDLFTSAWFDAAREFAETVAGWARERDGSPWAILSADQRVSMPWENVPPCERTIEDIGDDPANEDHWADSALTRRPDGREIVTEMDHWASMVAYDLARWVASHREQGALPFENDASTLLVVAPEDLVAPLRERGVFEYGIDRMAGDPNKGRGPDGHPTFPLRTRFLCEEIDADSREEQLAWLSDAVARLDDPADAGDQHALGDWSGDERVCTGCGGRPPETTLDTYDGDLYCPDCAPEQCARCGGWTHETGLGSYALCEGCQTDRGGQKRTPVETDPTEQVGLGAVTGDDRARTDGGESDGD